MKTTKKFIVILNSVLLAFFLIALIYFAFSNSEKFLYNILLAQLIVFFLAAASVIVYSVMPLFREVRVPKRDVNRIALLSDANTQIDEFSLVNITSALISKGETVHIDQANTSLIDDEYAVLNCIENYWYVERISDERSVGLKRAGEQYVYKLKTGMCYRLHGNDILYIENQRLLIM